MNLIIAVNAQVSPPPIGVLTTQIGLTDKISFVDPHHLSNIWGRNSKTTNKVTLRATNK